MLSFSWGNPSRKQQRPDSPTREIVRSQLLHEHFSALFKGGITLSQTTLQLGLIDTVNEKLTDSRYEITDIACEPKGIRMGIRARGPVGIHTTYPFYLVFSEFTLTKDTQRIRLKINGAGKGILKEVTNLIVQVVKLIIETLLTLTFVSTDSSEYLNKLNPTEIEIDLSAIESWKEATRVKFFDVSIFEWLPFHKVIHLDDSIRIQADLENWKPVHLFRKIKATLMN